MNQPIITVVTLTTADLSRMLEEAAEKGAAKALKAGKESVAEELLSTDDLLERLGWGRDRFISYRRKHSIKAQRSGNYKMYKLSDFTHSI